MTRSGQPASRPARRSVKVSVTEGALRHKVLITGDQSLSRLLRAKHPEGLPAPDQHLRMADAQQTKGPFTLTGQQHFTAIDQDQQITSASFTLQQFPVVEPPVTATASMSSQSTALQATTRRKSRISVTEGALRHKVIVTGDRTLSRLLCAEQYSSASSAIRARQPLSGPSICQRQFLSDASPESRSELDRRPSQAQKEAARRRVRVSVTNGALRHKVLVTGDATLSKILRPHEQDMPVNAEQPVEKSGARPNMPSEHNERDGGAPMGKDASLEQSCVGSDTPAQSACSLLRRRGVAEESFRLPKLSDDCSQISLEISAGPGSPCFRRGSLSSPRDLTPPVEDSKGVAIRLSALSLGGVEDTLNASDGTVDVAAHTRPRTPTLNETPITPEASTSTLDPEDSFLDVDTVEVGESEGSRGGDKLTTRDCELPASPLW